MKRQSDTSDDAPILDLAIHGDTLASAHGDGGVRTWRIDGAVPKELATLHDSEKKPMTALAACETGFVGAGSSLVSWSLEGKVLARADLPDVATNVVVRGDVVFVLAGRELLSFALPKLTAGAKVKLAKGVTCELDVDDKRKRALVVRDNKHVELLDLEKKKSLADWTRPKSESVSVRFDAKGKVLCATDDERRFHRVKDTTGRITGEVVTLERFSSNGPIVLDRARKMAAVGSGGEDVELVEIDPPRTVFHLDPMITDGGEKSLASLGRIPRFKQIAPGFFARHGSVEAPPPPSTLSAIAIGDGGAVVAAGYMNGEIVVASTTTGAIVSSTRGRLAEPRLSARLPLAGVATTFHDGDDLWILEKTGRTTIVDLRTHTMRAGPTLAFDDDLAAAVRDITTTDDAIVSVGDRVIRWSKKDGAMLGAYDLPESKGAFVHDGKVLFLPIASLGHEGFDIDALDLATGETKRVVHFVRDEKRFALGDKSTEWVRFGRSGTQPTLTIWAGRGLTVAETYVFDLATGTLGRQLGHYSKGHDAFVVETDFSNPMTPRDAVTVTNAETGEEVLRCPYEPGDSPKATRTAFDPVTRMVAAQVGEARVAVWRPGGSRLVVHGTTSVWGMSLRANSLVVRHRDFLTVWNVA